VTPLKGSFYVLILYDVAEQIQLDRLREIIGAEPSRREPSFKHRAPGYVRFEPAPVVEYAGSITVSGGDHFESRIKYFDYGVVSVELELPFTAGWEDLTRLSSRLTSAPEIEARTLELAQAQLSRVKSALIQPYDVWLSEDYYAIHIADAGGGDDGGGDPLPAATMLARHGEFIARIVRGESVALSESERDEALAARISYYPGDLLVAGWVAALVYDTPESAAAIVDLLEYANSQLLEYRHYDELLTRVLKNAYGMLEHKGLPLIRHWRMARQAARLNAMRLDIIELTERTDNAIKFLSDMYYARAYRMASSRVGVADYRNLVEQKLRIAGDLYEFMVNEFHQFRGFVLEVMVVAILVIELIHVFR
jgi:hypothetical protein